MSWRGQVSERTYAYMISDIFRAGTLFLTTRRAQCNTTTVKERKKSDVRKGRIWQSPFQTSERGEWQFGTVFPALLERRERKRGQKKSLNAECKSISIVHSIVLPLLNYKFSPYVECIEFWRASYTPPKLICSVSRRIKRWLATPFRIPNNIAVICYAPKDNTMRITRALFVAPFPPLGLNAESIEGRDKKCPRRTGLSSTDPQIEETDRTPLFFSLPLWNEIAFCTRVSYPAFSITSRALTGNFDDGCIQKRTIVHNPSFLQ